ncbi:MAG TPA: hypothetical protein VGL61_36310 [Kofleriaceae bacterium]|jgi:hypothetical protein
MPDDLAALLEECQRTPDQDAPRLAWADAVGGERGELVVLQCVLAGGGLSIAHAAELRHRQRELIRTHGVAWSQLDGIARRCVFRRGFVDAIEIEGADAASLALERAPLATSLVVTGLTLDGVDRLLAQPGIARLRGLTLVELGAEPRHLDHRVVERVVGSPALAELRALGLHARIGEDGVRRLLESTLLGGLERLAVPRFDWSDAWARTLFARAPRLRAFEMFWGHGAEIAAVLPPTIVELAVPTASLRARGGERSTIEALVESAAAATLERLALRGTFGERVELLARLPRLRSLDLSECQLGLMRNPPSHWKTNLAFAGVAMPALRELAMSPYTRGDELPALAKNLGPQLEQFSVRELGKLGEAKLRRQFAGVVSSDSFPAWSKQIASVETRGPWLDDALVLLRR